MTDNTWVDVGPYSWQYNVSGTNDVLYVTKHGPGDFVAGIGIDDDFGGYVIQEDSELDWDLAPFATLDEAQRWVKSIY